MSDNRYTLFKTEWGWAAALHRGDVLRQLVFGHPNSARAREALPAGKRGPAVATVSTRPPDWVNSIREYFEGKGSDFSSISLDLADCSSFRREVYRVCRRILPGQVKTYGEVASETGNPGASRAVGSAMAANPFPIVVPCHRVVRSDGSPGNYSGPGGMDTKIRLLDHEKRYFAS
jgi:methylated-DNA-[protein]-cysteine S-methyltransferase